MRINSKIRLLEAGAEIIHLKGFHNTGIQEILQAAGVPKGSFYNHFSNKEDFGLQLIDHFVDFFSSVSKPILENTALSPLQRIKDILEWFMNLFAEKDFAYGCPIGNLAQEMGDLSPAFRDKLKYALEKMVDVFSEILLEAQARGEISQRLDVRKAAEFLVSSWHGALVHMKAIKNLDPLENHMQFIFEYVLKPEA